MMATDSRCRYNLLVRNLMTMTKMLSLLLLCTFPLLGCEPSSSRTGGSRGSGPSGRAVLRPPQDFPGSSPQKGVRRPPPRDNGDPGMLPLIRRALEGYDGPIAYLGERDPEDRRFAELEKRVVNVEDDPFSGTDSAPARAALQKARASFVIVSALDPPIPPWPSEGASTIRELLRDGVPPPGFDPLVIGRAHLLYRVDQPFAVTEDQMASITAYLRARLAGKQARGGLDVPEDARVRSVDGKVRFIIAVRGIGHGCHQGRAEGFTVGEGTTVRGSLDNAVTQLRRRWSPTRRRLGCSREMPRDIDDAMAHLTLQVELVHRMAALTDREEDRLFWLIELGREGVYLQRGEQTLMVSPSRTIHAALDNELSMVERLGRWNDLSEEVWTNETHEFGRFETFAWLELRPGAEPLALYRGLPLVRVHDIDRESLVEGLVLGAQFLVRNQESSGAYRYLYRPLRNERERWTTNNNIVRHSLCPLVVLRAHQLSPDPVLLRSAKRGIDYTLSHLRHREERCHIWYQAEGDSRGNAKMGTVAAMVISIIEMGESADIEEYRDELTCLGEQILAMQERSGRFTHYDVPVGHPFYGRHNTIYPGELMLALSRLFEWSGDTRFREAFDRAMEFQRNWFREMSAETRDDGIYDERHRVDLISFEPWGVMAVDDMHRQTGQQRYVDFGFELAEFMDGLFQFDFRRAQYADYLGGYFKTQLELPAINSCGYTEGAAAAYRLALRSGQRIAERRQRLLFGLRYVLQLQYHPERSLFHMPDPEMSSGGFRYNLSFSRVRNDYMYHALNALALAALTLRDEDYPAHVDFGDVPEILEPAFAPDRTPTPPPAPTPAPAADAAPAPVADAAPARDAAPAPAPAGDAAAASDGEATTAAARTP